MSLCTKPFIWKCVPPQVHFHPNSLSHESFAQRLVLKQTYKVTGKWLNLSINLMVPWKSYAHNIWTSQPHNLFNFVAPNPPTASVKCYLTVQMWNVISIDAFKNQESSFEAGVSSIEFQVSRRSKNISRKRFISGICNNRINQYWASCGFLYSCKGTWISY